LRRRPRSGKSSTLFAELISVPARACRPGGGRSEQRRCMAKPEVEWSDSSAASSACAIRLPRISLVGACRARCRWKYRLLAAAAIEHEQSDTSRPAEPDADGRHVRAGTRGTLGTSTSPRSRYLGFRVAVRFRGVDVARVVRLVELGLRG
jgi:hypothetical protein